MSMKGPAQEEAPDDAALMRLAGRGDQRAFQRLMQRHLAQTVRLAGRMLGSDLHAEDAAQEAFVRVWRHAPAWRDEETAGARFTTWLYKIVLRLCIDQKRKNRFVPLDDAFDAPDASPGAEAGLEAAEKGKRIRQILQDLPERQRAALVLTFYEELSNQEAARVMGVSVKALESLLVRARRTLREKLKEERP
jgi:RNA polymerase sigma-70 factor (ECF subfamily)